LRIRELPDVRGPKGMMKKPLDVRLYADDLPHNVVFERSVGIDTETMGLESGRDRLCLVQLCQGDGICHLVQIAKNKLPAPRLKAMLTNPNVEKIFHFARFDIRALYVGLDALCAGPIYCTKIASRLVRTYTQYHGLASLCRELLGTDLSKTEQCSDWGVETLTESQKHYAASDVLYLHALKSQLDVRLNREGRQDLFKAICRFLPTRVVADVAGFSDDLFSH
jgi:ribonuclease D